MLVLQTRCNMRPCAQPGEFSRQRICITRDQKFSMYDFAHRRIRLQYLEFKMMQSPVKAFVWAARRMVSALL